MEEWLRNRKEINRKARKFEGRKDGGEDKEKNKS